ncbi:MAG: hypothetical protein HQL96_17405 [Magnetococcales bacterium]|nr:hypothetical protein [Magnetococcales bacterium]
MLINQSEWARQQGFSRQYVSKLVAKGIVCLVDGKVDTNQAAVALEAIREPAREPQRKSQSTPATAPAITPATAPAPVVMPAPSQPVPSSKPATKPAPFLDLPGGSAGDLPTLLLKARIKSEVKRASLLEIREKMEIGKLVDADEMQATAFNRGHAIRAAWEAWPNRVAGPMGAELGVETRTMRSTLEKFVREHLLELAGLLDGEHPDE